jgi:signal transduction histidine kinase
VSLNIKVYVITPAETIELSDDEWLVIKLAVFIIIVLLFFAFGFAMHKLSKRLIEPVVQLNRQLQSASLPQAFTVPNTSAAEFNQLAQSLNFYRQQTDAMIKQEQSFARYASHELRTPLTVIMGAAKLLEQDVSEIFQAKQRDRILRSAFGMQQTVDALLQLVKQEKGTEPDVPRMLLRQEVDSILESLQPLAKNKSVNLTLQFEQAPIILLKPAVVKILLTNIISNAIHASNKSEIRIVITRDKISVKDQGRGLDKAVKETKDGHGLGLLIVDAICQRYQLIFSLSANSDSGCSANLVLPQLYLPVAHLTE